MRAKPIASMTEAMQTATNETIAKLCDHIRRNCQTGDPMPLPELSRQAGISLFHLQRLFTRVVGVSPKRFAQACRLEAFKSSLRDGSPVTDAIYNAGFNSSSRVYEHVNEVLGMTPRLYRSGGEGLPISYATVETSIGTILLAATDRGLCSVEIGDDPASLIERLRAEYPKAALMPMSEPYPPLFVASIEALNLYLERSAPPVNLPVDVQATAFQAKVWRYLQAIPAGEVRTYADVAEGIGQPKAVRAVARACATNRIALVIPCHRVIRSDGKTGEYRWGAKRKKQLLERERRIATA